MNDETVIREARARAVAAVNSANRVIDAAAAKLTLCYAETLKVIADEAEKLGLPDPFEEPARHTDRELAHAP